MEEDTKDAGRPGDSEAIGKILRAIFEYFQLCMPPLLQNARRTEFGQTADLFETLAIGYEIKGPIGYFKIWRKSKDNPAADPPSNVILMLTVGRIDKFAFGVDREREITHSLQIISPNLTFEESVAISAFSNACNLIRYPDRLKEKYGI